MFTLTREVRFAINAGDDPQLWQKPTNTYGGYPSVVGMGLPLTVRVTVAGSLDPQSAYLMNIKTIDAAVLEQLPALSRRCQSPGANPGQLIQLLHQALYLKWPERLRRVELRSTPTLGHSIDSTEPTMMKLSQRFEFSASHRLHNPSLDDAQNAETYGKCNNVAGHGHNYEVQVTLRGTPGPDGVLMHLPTLEHAVARHAIDLLDHKHLNTEVDAFAGTIPSVENIAKVIYTWLKPVLKTDSASLASVTVWETQKTWCEYTET